MLKSSLLLNAVRLLGGKDGNENSDGEAGRALCSGEEVDSDNRIRQWLLDCRPPTTELGPPVDTKQSSSPVEIKKLQDAFVNADNLKNKLKCFIVQACRGNQVDVPPSPPSPPTQARVDNLHNLGITCYLYH